MTNLTFTAWPEMLAWPYLMLHGWLPYRDIAIAHNPLLLLDLVIFFKIFGVGILQLKIFTWILISINTYLVYFVAIKFWNKKTAYLSSIVYLLLSIVFEGNGLWFDLALTPFALLLYLFIREKKYAWAGVIFALGFLTKQTFIYFLIPVLLSKINLKKFVIGGLPVAIVFAVYLFANNLISSYYDWAIKFGILYLPNAVGQVSLPSLKQLVFAISPFLLLLFSTHYSLISFAIAGAMGVYPRWELFHFQPALPFVAIAISTFFFGNSKKWFKYLALTFLVIYLSIGIKRNLSGATRFFESDVQTVSSEINDYKISSLYVINYWDNVYALTNTMPATRPLIPYIPWYLDYDNNKDKILKDLKAEMPEAVVIGERDTVFPEIYLFVDKFYECKVVEKKVELCRKNKI